MSMSFISYVFYTQISAIQNVNQHFKKTVWDSANGYVSMGFQIDEVSLTKGQH